MDELIKKIEEIIGDGYYLQGSSFIRWVYDSSTSKPVDRIDLNYALEMDKRNELENYLNTIIK